MYLRNISLQVGANGSGLELAPNQKVLPKITFKTFQHTKETPNHCQIRVYNLAQSTVQTIAQEYTQVVLSAGYDDGPYGTIFNGTIVQVKVGYEGMGGVDSYIDIIAADGDKFYTGLIVNSSVAAGSTFQQRLNALMQAGTVDGSGNFSSGLGSGSSSGNGTGTGGQNSPSLGYVNGLSGGQLPRGRVFYGNWRDHMRDLTASTDTTWWMENGQVNIMPLNGGVLPGQAIVLTSSTGLIGWPEQTELGIKIRSLLNPNIKPGCQVTIQNSKVLQQTVNTNYNGATSNAFIPSISADGTYNVIVCEFSGDTRGNDWYADLICLAPNSVIPQGLVTYGAADTGAATALMNTQVPKGYTGWFANNSGGTGGTGQ